MAPRADIPLAKLGSSCPTFGCTHAARRWYQPLQDGLGVEAAGIVSTPLVLSEFAEFSEISELLERSELSVLRDYGTI